MATRTYEETSSKRVEVMAIKMSIKITGSVGTRP